jgi:hypothetical protein
LCIHLPMHVGVIHITNKYTRTYTRKMHPHVIHIYICSQMAHAGSAGPSTSPASLDGPPHLPCTLHGLRRAAARRAAHYIG